MGGCFFGTDSVTFKHDKGGAMVGGEGVGGGSNIFRWSELKIGDITLNKDWTSLRYAII